MPSSYLSIKYVVSFGRIPPKLGDAMFPMVKTASLISLITQPKELPDETHPQKRKYTWQFCDCDLSGMVKRDPFKG